MHERARFMNEVRAEIRKPVQLFEPVRHVAREYRDIVIRVLSRIPPEPATRTGQGVQGVDRTSCQDALEAEFALAAALIEARPKAE